MALDTLSSYLGKAVDVSDINAAQSWECHWLTPILSILSWVMYSPPKPKFAFLFCTICATASPELTEKKI